MSSERVTIARVYGCRPNSSGFGVWEYEETTVYLDGEKVFSTNDKYEGHMFAAELKARLEVLSADVNAVRGS